MLPLPHRYAVTAAPVSDGSVHLTTSGVRALTTDAPAEFDGPGDAWSPETLLVGAAADCFAITFRGVARASRLPWDQMTCEATGVLDRVDGAMRFTHLDFHVRLALPDAASEDLARRVLDKVKRQCLITNSLNAEIGLHTTIEARTIEVDGCPV